MGKLTLKILKDTDGNPVELSQMSINATESLNDFIENLLTIAKHQPSRDKIRIDIRSGCAEVSLVTNNDTEFDLITDDLEKIMEKESVNVELIKSYRNIQNRIKSNGLTYQVLLEKENGARKDLTEKFIQSKRFSRRVVKRVKNVNIEFIKGELIQNGGEKPNFHIKKENNTLLTISCNKEQAKMMNEKLYDTVHIAVWKKNKLPKPELVLCENFSETDYSFFEEKINKISTAGGTEKHHLIFDLLNELKNNDARLIQVLALFNNKNIEKGILRTVLISMKNYKNTNSKVRDALSCISNS